MNDLSALSLKALLEHAHIGVVIHRADTTIVYANPAALRLLRLSYDQMIGKDALDPGWNFIDEHNRRLHPEEYPVQQVVRLRAPLRNQLIGVVDDRSPEVSWFSVNAYLEGDLDSTAGFVVVVFSDVTADKERFSFKDIVERAEDVIIVTEADDIDAPCGPRIVYVNEAFERLTGYTAAEVIGETPRILQGSLTSKAACDRIRQALARKEPVREKLLNYGKTGVPYWLDMAIVPLRNRYGKVTHFAAIERNVSDQIFRAEQLERRNKDLKALKENLQLLVEQRMRDLRDANRKLERLAYYDALTSIPNRRSFLDQTEQQLARAARLGQRVALGVIDLDQFKLVNDQHGHSMGDRALVETAAFLKRFFRREDCFGRFGGEEFAFCLLLQADADAAAVAERLRQGIAELDLPTPSGSLTLTASIGLLVFVPGTVTVQQAIGQADRAMYQAKHKGRNRVETVGADGVAEGDQAQ